MYMAILQFCQLEFYGTVAYDNEKSELVLFTVDIF
jgi:hypothetical protein